MKSLGIVGYGRMGRLLASALKDRYHIHIYDIRPEVMCPRNYRLYEDLKTLVLDSDIIMVATPINTTPEALTQIRDYFNELKCGKKIVFDIASIKSGIIDILTTFPRDIGVCSIHPLFGPDVPKIDGEKIIIIPVRNDLKTLYIIEHIFTELGVKTIRCDDPLVHDKAIAVTIILPYIIAIGYGLVANKFGIEVLEDFGGPSFKYLMNYSRRIYSDNPSLIYDLIMNNKSKNIFNEFIETVIDILELSDRRDFRLLIEKVASSIYSSSNDKYL
jgi:prephenate dehydrogenase